VIYRRAGMLLGRNTHLVGNWIALAFETNTLVKQIVASAFFAAQTSK
jgi:hypothetical protein